MTKKPTTENDGATQAPAGGAAPSGLGSHPMSLAVVAGLFGLAVAFVSGYYSSSSSGPDLGPRVAELEKQLEAAKKESEALKQEIATLEAPQSIIETVTIMERGTASIMERTYVASVDKIGGGVAQMSFRAVEDGSGYIDKKDLSAGGRINLSSKAYRCALVVDEVLGFAVKVSTECKPV